MSSVFVASQSSCFFLCSREQIRLVENRLKPIHSRIGLSMHNQKRADSNLRSMVVTSGNLQKVQRTGFGSFMRSIKFNRANIGKYSVHLLVMIIELSNFRRNFSDLPSFQVVPFVQNCAVVLLEFPKLNLFIEIKDFLRTPCVKTLFHSSQKPNRELAARTRGLRGLTKKITRA